MGEGSRDPRLIALRTAACDALNGQPPFARNIRLKVEIHVSPQELSRIGVLDNFITGICDGLMAANARIRSDERWMAIGLEPTACVAITDDSQVTSIDATKVGDSQSRWYQVTVEGE